jgi:hypothetical protein
VPSYAIATLGAFVFDGVGGASIKGDIVIGPVPRTVQAAANALSSYPVQVLDYFSDFGEITFLAKLAGRETISETAPNHLQRMWHNLGTEVGKDSNTFTIAVWGMDDPYVYSIVKNPGLEKTITLLTQSRSVMEFDVTLKYLP